MMPCGHDRRCCIILLRLLSDNLSLIVLRNSVCATLGFIIDEDCLSKVTELANKVSDLLQCFDFDLF